MGYNPNIRLNPTQLSMIEDALRAEVSRLARPFVDANNRCAGTTSQIREINELLAHLHDQKFWHRPKAAVPMG